MTTMLFVLVLAAGGPWDPGPWPNVEPTHSPASQLHTNDDVKQSAGNTADDPDCWWEWDTGAATHNYRLTCTDVDGGGTDGLALHIDTGTAVIVLSMDLDLNTNDKQLIIDAGTRADPAICFGDDDDGSCTGFYRTGADELGVTSNDTLKLKIGATIQPQSHVILAADLDVRLQGTGEFQMISGTRLQFPSNGDLIITDSTGAQGVKFDTASTDGTLILTDESGGGLNLDLGSSGSLMFGAATRDIEEVSGGIDFDFGTRLLLEQQTDHATAGDGMVTISSVTNAEMTATSGSQYGIELLPEIDQSGTAAFTAIHADVTDTASGSGQDYLLDLNWGGSPMFRVTDAGSVIAPGIIGDLDATCTTGQVGLDTGGATKEICICQTTDTWYCAAVDDTTGPAD